MAFQLRRARSTPILPKGGTYDGWKVDAFAAPSATWDGTQFVWTASAWNIANSQWASLFFTSSNLITTPTYVTGSIRTPASYLLGNGSIEWLFGKYWFAYVTDPAGGVPKLDYSTDLIHWTNVATYISTGTDPGLCIGPTGNLELWRIDGSPRSAYFADSPDGSTWTDHGSYLTGPSWSNSTLGEAHAFNIPGYGRLVLADVFSASSGDQRMRALFTSTGFNTSWTTLGSCLGPTNLYSWESTQAFDGEFVGIFDFGDGNGPRLWAVYAGGDNTSSADDTDSSIGLAYMAVPGAATPSTGTANGSSSAAGQSVSSGTASGLASAIGQSVSESAASASSAASAQSVSLATAAGGSSATAVPLGISNGTATGTSQATGQSISAGVATGAAAAAAQSISEGAALGTSTATAASLSSNIGTALGSSTAFAKAMSLALAAGSSGALAVPGGFIPASPTFIDTVAFASGFIDIASDQ